MAPRTRGSSKQDDCLLEHVLLLCEALNSNELSPETAEKARELIKVSETFISKKLTCHLCKTQNTSQQWIQCGFCLFWVHDTCAQVDTTSVEGQPWFCCKRPDFLDLTIVSTSPLTDDLAASKPEQNDPSPIQNEGAPVASTPHPADFGNPSPTPHPANTDTQPSTSTPLSASGEALPSFAPREGSKQVKLPSGTIITADKPRTNPQRSGPGAGGRQPPYRPPFSLKPRMSSLVISNSQLKPVHQLAVDGSGSCQLFSIGGSTIPEMKRMMDGAFKAPLSRRANIRDIIILLGGNDLAQGATPDAFRDDVIELTQLLMHAFPHARLSFFPVLPRPDLKKEQVEQCNDAVLTIPTTNLRIIPLSTLNGSHFRGRVHLNYAGLQEVVELIQSTLGCRGHRATPLIRPEYQGVRGLQKPNSRWGNPPPHLPEPTHHFPELPPPPPPVQFIPPRTYPNWTPANPPAPPDMNSNLMTVIQQTISQSLTTILPAILAQINHRPPFTHQGMLPDKTYSQAVV